MKDCLFCKIIKGEIPCTKVYEDEKTLAFLDINPTNIGHTLVIPKNHSRNIFDIKKEDLESVYNTSQRIAQAIKNSLGVDGVNIISNNESAAGQLVFHTHIHIVPRLENDGFRHWKGKRGYEDGEAEETALKIQNDLNM
ncbi:hypothetical protein A2442_01965 [Candidatus Campbellbacteria bacterium RIFOXYC2_FULL_35_25]|uniref:HIT domain-containing protein n=1 Tax=Candidatus Campbellbacteria bacterium RIFOXYC2_FULL_35_25 TaxID=1797582 RepID=A0A1F5EIA6_9BACT|nr:MAG: hypothetical protein A2442_01965 [Candidatus Campbellbacteria bacterium RIFOXYC2_FULL_35_25]